MTPKRLHHRNHAIRPAPLRDLSAAGQAGAGAGMTPPSPITIMPAKRRGPQTTLACDACRTRKTKCNGLRPCEACRAKNLQCHYDKEGREKNKTSVLRTQLADLRAIVKRLSDATDDEVAEIRRRLRDSHDVSRIVRDLCGGPLTPSSSFEFPDDGGERSVSPDSMSTSTSSSSQKLPSIDFLPSMGTAKGAAPENMRVPTKLELFKIARQRAMVDAVLVDHVDEHGELNFSISIPPISTFPTAFQRTPIVRRSTTSVFDSLRPLPARAVFPFISVRSHQRMPISAAHASHLACLWLSYHAFSSPYVQPTDLIGFFNLAPEPGGELHDGQLLLCNAVLALSCLYLPQPDRASADEARSLSQHFTSQVKCLWHSQHGAASVSNAQALLAQYDLEKLAGRDRVGWHSLAIAVGMGQDLGLHSIHSSDNTYHADIFAAWGVFNHQAIESLIYNKPPLQARCWTARTTRIVPSCITDSWHAYCLADTAINSSFWDHWDALCDLADIATDATLVLHGERLDGFAVLPDVLVAQTQHARYRLAEWFRALPNTLSLARNESPHNLWLHMMYFTTLITLNRPYTSPSLSAREPRDVVQHARTVMLSAARSIARLCALALSHYTAAFMPASHVAPLGTAVFVLVDDLSDAESAADFADAVAVLAALGDRFLLAKALALAVGAVATRMGAAHVLGTGSAAASRMQGEDALATRWDDDVASDFPTFVNLPALAARPQRRPEGATLTELLAALRALRTTW